VIGQLIDVEHSNADGPATGNKILKFMAFLCEIVPKDDDEEVEDEIRTEGVGEYQSTQQPRFFIFISFDKRREDRP
jgi:hypothetical protein